MIRSTDFYTQGQWFFFFIFRIWIYKGFMQAENWISNAISALSYDILLEKNCFRI